MPYVEAVTFSTGFFTELCRKLMHNFGDHNQTVYSKVVLSAIPTNRAQEKPS
jgi:hypothetical protein